MRELTLKEVELVSGGKQAAPAEGQMTAKEEKKAARELRKMCRRDPTAEGCSDTGEGTGGTT